MPTFMLGVYFNVFNKILNNIDNKNLRYQGTRRAMSNEFYTTFFFIIFIRDKFVIRV